MRPTCWMARWIGARAMSPQLIIISGILRHYPAQVRFAQNNHMVDALASDRSDQSFGKAVLPRRARGDRLVADAHGAQSVHDGNAVDAVPITDSMASRYDDLRAPRSLGRSRAS